MLHTKNEWKWSRGRPRTRWIDHIRKGVEMRGGNWVEIKENRSGRIEMARDFSVIGDPYLWKWLKNDDNDEKIFYNY